MINSNQRAKLRSMANGIETIQQIGKGGLTENSIAQIDEALEARELIKIRLLETAPLDAKEAAVEAARLTKSDVVQVIGTRFVLYRKRKKEPKIIV